MENEKQSVCILGTVYAIETHKTSEDKFLKDNSWSGYCDEINKLIVVADLNDTDYFSLETDKEREIEYKRILRHEIIHAFLNESGLQDSSLHYSGGWAKNEEMVDWLAIQAPKIHKAFESAGAI